MVRVITIRDDVYNELSRLKKSRNMSFSQIIEYLIKEKEGKTKNIISLAGSLNKEDIEKRVIEKTKNEFKTWGR